MIHIKHEPKTWKLNESILIDGNWGYFDLNKIPDRQRLVKHLNKMEKEIAKLENKNRDLEYIEASLGLIESSIKEIKEIEGEDEKNDER